MLAGKRVFIVEAEFLVALDIQRILEGAQAEATVFARSVKEAQGIADRFADFDLAILEMSEPDLSSLALAQELAGAGVALVVISADLPDQHDRPILDGAPVVAKPFGDEELLTACVLALATSNC